MRVLVTNDDGIDAPGILALARAVQAEGYETIVAAPLSDQSGCGASFGRINPNEPIHLKPVQLPGLDVEAYALDGPPAQAVVLARMGAFGTVFDPPDLVVSGVNPGLNTGPSLLHSGTLGAALTAGNFGLSALAVSVALPPVRGRPRFAVAAAVAAAALAWLADAPPGTVLNLNVPDRDHDELRGVRWAVPSPISNITAAIVDATDGRLRVEVTDNDGQAHLPGTDTWTVDEGYVAVTSVVGPRATQEVPAPAALERSLAARRRGTPVAGE